MFGTASCNQSAIKKHKVIGRKPMKSYGHVKSLFRKGLMEVEMETRAVFFFFLSHYNEEKVECSVEFSGSNSLHHIAHQTSRF